MIDSVPVGHRSEWELVAAKESSNCERQSFAAGPNSTREVALHASLLFGVNVIFAGNALLSKVSLDKGVNPIAFSLLRDLLAAVILLFAAFATDQWRAPVDKSEVARVVLLGLLGICGGQLLFLVALLYVQPASVAMFQLLQPLFTPLLSAALGMEPLWQGSGRSALRLGGLVVSVLGAAVVIGSTMQAGKQHMIQGILVLAAQVLCGSSFMVLMRHLLLAKWPPLSLVASSYTVGAMVLSLWAPFMDHGSWHFDLGTRCVLAYSVLLTTIFNYIAMASVNQSLGPTVVTAFFPLQPVLVALGQPLFGLGLPTPVDIAALVVVVIGLGMFLSAEFLKVAGV